MLHIDDNISLFVTLFNIAVRLDEFLQRINLVNRCFYLTRLHQLFKLQQVFELIASIRVAEHIEVDATLFERFFTLRC